MLASRLPWIGVDYGADPDSYRVVNAARQIAASGRYIESRLPGYPVHEYASALLVPAGPLASNLATAVLSVVAALFVALILERWGVRESIPAAAAFALTPVVYVNSTCSIDYVWAIAFVLGALYFALLGRPYLAGALLGLGTGCRLTSAAMILPLGLLLLVQGPPERRRSDLARFAVATGMVGAACFAPVWLRHGWSFFTFRELSSYPNLTHVIERATTGVWGTVGTIAWLLAGPLAFLSARRAGGALREAPRRSAFLLCVTVVALYGAAYARLPLDAGYLVPVVPFAIMALGLVAPSRVFRVFCLALCFSPFIDVGRKGITLGGPLAADRVARLQDDRGARAVIEAASQLPEQVVVVCGSMQPRILSMIVAGPSAERFLYLIDDAAVLEPDAGGGEPVRFVPGADLENLALNGIDLRALGAEEIRPR